MKFEKAIGELETLVEQLEAGSLSLEDSLKTFEKGVRLTRECQKALQEAKQKVQLLVQDGASETLMDFTEAEDSSENE